MPQSKGNQTIKFCQVIEYSKKNTFLQMSCRNKTTRETSSRASFIFWKSFIWGKSKRVRYTYSFTPGWLSPLGWVRPWLWSNLSFCIHVQPRWNLTPTLISPLSGRQVRNSPRGNSAWFERVTLSFILLRLNKQLLCW